MVETGEDDEKLSDEDAVAAADCLDFIEGRRQVYLATAKAAWEKAGAVKSDIPKFNIQEFKEIYLPIDDLKFDDCLSTTAGYVDHTLISWDETEADLADWKFGFWAVEPTVTNLQAIAYSLGAFKKFPKLQQVRFWFKQPHLDSLDSHVFRRADIPALYLRVQAVVARARKAREAGDYASATPYVPVCNFCDHLGECPIGLNFALKVAKKFSPLEFPSDVTPSMILDPQNTLVALNLASVMKVWSEAFRRQVTDRVLRRDAPIPEGYGIQEMPGRRSIVDMAKFKEISLKYVKPEDYEKCLDATFKPLEDAIIESAARGVKKSTVIKFQQELEQFGAVKRGQSFSFLKIKNGKNNTEQ